MTFAEEKTYQYIRRYHSNFCSIHVLEILPYLYCLTTSDQDRLRAYFNQWGNQNTLWELFHSLQRRQGWVDAFIQALRICEKTELADEVASVYQSFLLPPREPASVPAKLPGPSTTSATPSTAHNGYREELRSLVPVQDSQSPQFLGEDSKTASQTSSSGTDFRKSGDPQEPTSDMAARRPLSSGGHQEQDTEPSSAHTAGVASGLTSPRGPVSPTVSFQPLARPNPRASRLPGPPVSAPYSGISPPSTGFSSVGGASDPVEDAIYSSVPGVSINSMTTSTVPSKLPINSSTTGMVSSKGPTNPAFANTVPSKLPTSSLTTSAVPSKGPTSSKPPGTMTTNMPTSLPASKLPINSARAGTVSPKVPTSLVPDHRMPMSSVPSKASADTVPTIKSSKRPTEETPASPVPTGAMTGGSSPHPDRSAGSWSPELELSKPDVLMSRLDSSFSGCSGDLAISYSTPLNTGRDNTPEENEYQTLESIRIHVEEGASADLLAGNSRQQGALNLQKGQLPEEAKAKASWASWLRAATVGALLAGLLAVLYRRRLLQRSL
ncbi:mitochondrial antiviral-signaling protein isoform X1 [Talpa occidentalis]|uniref:mitochondrial antiviral-signaling protein isoform X1 n=1 Tax=Talpa occidentalis TaxID=50954 RepID=UPI00188FB9D8|nr:mitochondrial antiviral-signaling protein isoform X1 [Talpa occidentalis]XP_037354385.1 mitochondrial antiviral-signaling protein isoform X1 [Talpa occidentalis]XP_054553537.1 mitochondrial antiviral-signaling protein isoform X1 [Talpa occidentalis]